MLSSVCLGLSWAAHRALLFSSAGFLALSRGTLGVLLPWLSWGFLGISSSFHGALLVLSWFPWGYLGVSWVFLRSFEAPWALLRFLGVLLGLSWEAGRSWSRLEA